MNEMLEILKLTREGVERGWTPFPDKVTEGRGCLMNWAGDAQDQFRFEISI